MAFWMAAKLGNEYAVTFEGLALIKVSGFDVSLLRLASG